MTNDSQFVKVKSSINDLFRRIDNQPSSVRDKINEKMNGQIVEIAKATEQLNAELDNYFKELDAIKTEQLNERIAVLDKFCKAHEGTSFDILNPHTVDVDVRGEIYSIDVSNDEYLDSNLQQIDNLLKISKQLDKAGVNYRLRKNFGASRFIDEMRIILNEFNRITFDFTIDDNDTVKLKAQYSNSGLEYLKRQIDPLTTFEVEVDTRDHETFYVTITGTSQCKLENVASEMQRLAKHVSDKIDFKGE
jgi:hypothetical protein